MTPPPCDTNDNFLASPDFIQSSLHLAFVFELVIHSLGFYCIIFKTPLAMKSVKWMLLNLHSWCVILDFLGSFFSVPYTLFPNMSGYVLGVVDAPATLLYLIVTITNMVSVSVFLIFENRYHVLFGQNSWWRHVRTYTRVAACMAAPCYFLPAQFVIPEQVSARKTVVASLKCMPKLPDTDRQLFVLSLDFIAAGLGIVIAELVPTIKIGSFFFINVYKLIQMKSTATLSQRTIKIQRKLAVTLFIQTLVLLLMFSIPINTAVIVVRYQLQNQFISNFVWFTGSIHGIISTLIMIFIHKPYRDFVLTPFGRCCKRFKVVRVKATDSNSRGN